MDALLYNSSYNGGSGYTNNKSDLKQDGIENPNIEGDPYIDVDASLMSLSANS